MQLSIRARDAIGLFPVSSGENWQVADYLPLFRPLQMIGPPVGVGPNTVWTKWPIGKKWRFPIEVIGGRWPYRFRKMAGPSWLNFVHETLPVLWTPNGLIDFGYGEMEGITQAGTYQLTVRVEDQAHGRPDDSYVERTWNFTITDDGMLYVAPGGSNSNPGTESLPFQNMLGWFVNMPNTAYDNNFVFYRTGTYATSVIPPNGSETNRATIRSGKPHVHVAYPDEIVTWNVADRHMNFETPSDPMFIAFLRLTGMNSVGSYKAFATGGANNPTFFRLDFDGATTGSTTSTNPAGIFWAESGDTVNAAIMRCMFHDFNSAFGTECYEVHNSLFEGNVGVNIGDSLFYIKSLCDTIDIRGNINILGNTGRLLYLDTYNAQNYIDLTYNSHRTSGGDMCLIGNEGPPMGIIRIARNTFAGGAMRFNNSTTGSVDLRQNVRQHSGAGSPPGLVYEDGYNPALNSFTDELTGSGGLAGTLVDSNNLLTGANAALIGTRGHQILVM